MYTAATGKRALIKTITVSNSDAVLRAITIHLVPSGGTVGLSNAFMPAVAMPADSMLGWTGLMVLETGYTVQASANGTGLSLYVGGAERQS